MEFLHLVPKSERARLHFRAAAKLHGYTSAGKCDFQYSRLPNLTLALRLVLIGYPAFESALEAIQQQAHDYLVQRVNFA